MAKSQTTRLSPKVRAKDLELYSALKGIAGYAPANPAYTQQKMDLKHASVLTTRDAKAAADAAAEAADDNQTAAEWDAGREGSGGGAVWPGFERGAGDGFEEEE